MITFVLASATGVSFAVLVLVLVGALLLGAFSTDRPSWPAMAAAKSAPSAGGSAALKQVIARLVPGDPSELNRLLQERLPRAGGDRKGRI
jgi:hypothetical protein